jgi:hypothetical protein
MRHSAGWLMVCVLCGGLVTAPGRAQQSTTVPKPVVNPKLPKDAQASQFISRAEFFQSQRKYPEAATFLQAAAELIADDWQLWDRAGWAQIDAGNPTAALPDFDRAAKSAPVGTPLFGGALISHYLLGHAKDVEDLLTKTAAPERREALLAAAKAGMAKRGSADASFALGLLYSRALNYSPRGVIPLEAAVKAQPSLAEAWLLLYELNTALDRGPQASQAAIKYLGLKPDSPDAFRIRATRRRRSSITSSPESRKTPALLRTRLRRSTSWYKPPSRRRTTRFDFRPEHRSPLSTFARTTSSRPRSITGRSRRVRMPRCRLSDSGRRCWR